MIGLFGRCRLRNHPSWASFPTHLTVQYSWDYKKLALSWDLTSACFALILSDGGGATELYAWGHTLNDVRLFGRWGSERSCELYIKTGDVALTRLRQGIDDAQWRAVVFLANVFERIFIHATALSR